MKALKKLREKIDQTDAAIIKKIAARQKLVQQVGRLKMAIGIKVLDANREQQQMEKFESISAAYALDAIFIKRLFKMIITYSRKIQRK